MASLVVKSRVDLKELLWLPPDGDANGGWDDPDGRFFAPFCLVDIKDLNSGHLTNSATVPQLSHASVVHSKTQEQ